MSFSKEKKESITDYMLDNMWKQNIKRDIVQKTVDTYNISATTVNRYIKKLINEGIIEEKINNRLIRYKLISKTYEKTYYPKKEKLEEDIVYNEDFSKYFEDFDDNVKHMWAYCFTEMMNNAIEHSEGTEITCFLSQNHLKTIVVIEDNGIGIFNKIKLYNEEVLKKNITIEEACAQLFAGKLTTDKSRHSGEGIFFTSRIVDTFIILSSNTIFSHNAYAEKLIENDEIAKGIKIGKNGTAVFMFLSNTSPKSIKEVFSMFSNADKGFFKTQIPMKMMFENAYPVSRSQARRLYNTFDKFGEIVLDFKGIENIGQAFVHEMFIVYEKNNPEKKLIIENANDTINNMINRVKNTVN
mgnify:CR=1 FL=1